MKFSRVVCIAALCFSHMVGAEEALREPSSQVELDAAKQILAELRIAPRELVESFVTEEGKLREFIAGRLQDMAMADYARQRGLDREPTIVARRLVEERSDLVKGVMAEFQERERANLPDLEPLARQRYMATRQQYAIPEQIRVAHILLRADVEVSSEGEIAQQKASAQHLRDRLAAGEDFATLARASSEEPATAVQGGELPRFASKGTFVAPFDRAAWALGAGAVSDVVRTRFGFHIIKMLERKPASYRPFEEVRNELIQAVQDEILAPKRSAFVDSFRGKALEAKAALILPEIQDELKALQSRGTAENSAPAASAPGK